MNKENVSKLWKIIQEADDYLLDEFYLASSHSQQATGILVIGFYGKTHGQTQGLPPIRLLNPIFAYLIFHYHSR